MVFTTDAARHNLPRRGSCERSVESNQGPVRSEITASATTAEYLAGRLRRILFDLDLDQRLGGWVTPGPDGLEFTALAIRQVDALVLALEDVVTGRSTSLAAPGLNQPSLFQDDNDDQ